MSRAEVRWRLLVSASEDYSMLVEALWEVNKPGGPPPEETKEVLWGLVEEGLVELYWCQEVYGETTIIPPEQRQVAFADPCSWRLPQEGETGVRYTASPAGDEATGHRPPDVPEIDWSI